MHWAVDARASSSYIEPFPNVELSHAQLSPQEELRGQLRRLQGEIKATRREFLERLDELEQKHQDLWRRIALHPEDS
jgi:TolA-binding protein